MCICFYLLIKVVVVAAGVGVGVVRIRRVRECFNLIEMNCNGMYACIDSCSGYAMHIYF